MRKFPYPDHSQHIAELLAQLYKLETLVQGEDREAILDHVMDMDWRCIADEFELVVARHYYDVEHHARRAIHNLLRPYMLKHDCTLLGQHMRMLEEALDESPSLHADADADVATTWQQQLENAAFRHRTIREMPPVATLEDLRKAAEAKIALGQLLERRHAAFEAGERVPYAELLEYQSLVQRS